MTTSDIPLETVRLDHYGANTIARHLFTAALVAALVFLGAGRTDLPWAWVFGTVYFTCWLVLSLALWRYNPELLNIRGRRPQTLPGTKSWDWIVLSLYSSLMLVQPLVAGLDIRFGWSGAVAPWVMLAGNVILVGALALLTWSMVVNRSFEATVRIQNDRGHTVISTGPYRYVRHPGYTSVILTFLSVSIALGAWAAMIPGALGAITFIVRTALEDRTLIADLPGYAEFARQTRYRLIPGVW